MNGHDQTGMLVTLGLVHFYWPLSDECQELLDQQQLQQQQKLRQDREAKKKQRRQRGQVQPQDLLQRHDTTATLPHQAQQSTPSGETPTQLETSSQGEPCPSSQPSDKPPPDLLPVERQAMQATAQLAAQFLRSRGPPHQNLVVVPDVAVPEPMNIAAFQKIEPGKAANIFFNSTAADVPVWYLSLHAALAQQAQERLDSSQNLRASHEKCATARMKKEREEFSSLTNPDPNKLFLFGQLLRHWDLN